MHGQYAASITLDEGGRQGGGADGHSVHIRLARAQASERARPGSDRGIHGAFAPGLAAKKGNPHGGRSARRPGSRRRGSRRRPTGEWRAAPPHPEPGQAGRTVRFALTDAELSDAAHRAGLTRGAYAAEAALSVARGVVVTPDAPLRDAFCALDRAALLVRKISVNLNQAVAKLNAIGQWSGDLVPYAQESDRRGFPVATSLNPFGDYALTGTRAQLLLVTRPSPRRQRPWGSRPTGHRRRCCPRKRLLPKSGACWPPGA